MTDQIQPAKTSLQTAKRAASPLTPSTQQLPPERSLTAPKRPNPADPMRVLETAHLMLVAGLDAEGDPERDPSARLAEVLDRTLHYWMARGTLGLSPIALGQAYADWALHMAISPGKQMQLAQKGIRKELRLAHHYSHLQPGHEEASIRPLPNDKRFSAPEWKEFPFNMIAEGFLQQQQWWHNAVTGVRGVSAHHEAVLEFATRQILDVFSPSNFVATNPVVLQKTLEEGGQNLVRGWWNFLEDWERAINQRPPIGTEEFAIGTNLAMSPGKVVYRNRLIELIQYTPTTGKVRPEPVLVVPAWIMKYYILDLAPGKSLVEHLVGQGFTVFMISWLNPDSQDRDLTLDDYRRLGIFAALESIGRIVPGAPVHGVGYCLGGTLLAATAAAMARDNDKRLATLSFLASQVDFVEAGELGLFIDDSQLAMIDDMMWEQGYLDAQQMAGTFQMLRSNDLIWSHVIHDYLMGERRPAFDLMAWSADSTRMPYRMHSEYLRRFFLKNDLAEGRYEFDGRPVSLTDITCPVFAVATETDHIAPWRSVYKFNHILDTSVTFLLTSGGHNTGIVPDPQHSHPHYRTATHNDEDNYTDPDTWLRTIPKHEGSWWSTWTAWLTERSGQPVAPPAIGAPDLGLPPLENAPGCYVFRR